MKTGDKKYNMDKEDILKNENNYCAELKFLDNTEVNMTTLNSMILLVIFLIFNIGINKV